MNRSDFISMIEDTAPVNRQMIGEIFELIDIFPYFQSAHLLLLKGLQNNADVKFENQLRNSAIHIADREVLYYHLRGKTSSPLIQVERQSDVDSVDNLYNDTEQVVIEIAKNSNELISEIEHDSENIRLNSVEDDESKSSENSVVVSSDSENGESSKAVFYLDDERDYPEEEAFFMNSGFLVPDQSDLLELDLDEETVVPQQSDKRDMSSKKQEQIDLIDKFIIANPRIEPNREKRNPYEVEVSDTGLEEEGGFVTETLAKIYINQGYYSKAIGIYEKLSLKLPEKSSYFAFEIEKVKEYLKK